MNIFATKALLKRQINKQYENIFNLEHQMGRSEKINIFLYFLDEFFKNKKKENLDHFLNKTRKFMKSYDVFRNIYNKDAYQWREGQKMILQDIDKHPRSLFSITRKNLNYFKFLGFFKYFQDLYQKKNDDDNLRDAIKLLKDNQDYHNK